MNQGEDHRDRDVDAAWRAASDELPPRSLDATIAAAARRAVGAGPSRAHASRAWWPVAAAAVVAAVAVGIVEMTPPEQVAPSISPARETAAPVSEPAPTAKPAKPQQVPAEALPAPMAQPSAKTRQRSEAPRMQAAPASPSAPGAQPAAVPHSAPERRANAFPADRADSAPASNSVAAPSVSALPEPSSEKLSQPRAAADARATDSSATADELKTEASPGAAALGSRNASPVPGAPAALAKPAQRNEAQLERAERPTAEAWIALIRRLKIEGRNDLAAKELAAFRARYGERADSLLPADLREAKP